MAVPMAEHASHPSPAPGRLSADPREDLEDQYGVDRAEALYLPHKGRAGTALCLSGGGYRATLFHLGALTRLNELGILARVDTITSVSGGSILVGFLASRIEHWPKAGPIDRWDELVVQPARRLTARNIRTLWFFRLALPWRGPASTLAVRSLERTYKRHISAMQLADMHAHPKYALCATDLAFGQNWISSRTNVGDYEAGWRSPPRWPLARAIAASSCFPPIFGPMPIGIGPEELTDGDDDGHDHDDLVRGLRLSDGGLYDNLGLEPVWKTHRTLLVSDGGGTFRFSGDEGFPRRIARYIQVVEAQAVSLRKRWLIGGLLTGALKGTYWGIGSSPQSYNPAAPGYSKQVANEGIARIRTDLDAFTELEQGVLENHGYLIADAAIKEHASKLLPDPVPPVNVPCPAWLDGRTDAQWLAALAPSAKRKLLGRWHTAPWA
jgi:NTE family protein